MSKTQRSFVCTGFAAGGRQTPLVGYVNPAMARELQTLSLCEFPEHVSGFCEILQTPRPYIGVGLGCTQRDPLIDRHVAFFYQVLQAFQLSIFCCVSRRACLERRIAFFHQVPQTFYVSIFCCEQRGSYIADLYGMYLSQTPAIIMHDHFRTLSASHHLHSVHASLTREQRHFTDARIHRYPSALRIWDWYKKW